MRLTDTQIENALKWREKHRKHVFRLMQECNNRVEVSQEDANHPELWKPMHWRFLLERAVATYPSNAQADS